uniref:Uncharacterized protein n=1 Tax=Cucumis melo TaxID=3656 RepID=A0A9I9EAX2_CUCME
MEGDISRLVSALADAIPYTTTRLSSTTCLSKGGCFYFPPCHMLNVFLVAADFLFWKLALKLGDAMRKVARCSHQAKKGKVSYYALRC